MNKIMSAIGGSASGGKRIIISLAMIAAVGAIVVGATTAYFSDTETSTGNTFTAGTIDIAIDKENPWINNYHIGDLKPGETGYINFDITNEGTNPVNVSKTLTSITGSGGEAIYSCSQVVANTSYSASSEPECIAENGTAIDDVATQIIYDLSVKVYDESDVMIWWQAIYTDSNGESITDVYGTSGGDPVDLGMIPVKGHMEVTQSYHFNPAAGNQYQGDELSFNMTIEGEQLTGENGYAQVALENKTGPTAWDIIQDTIKGTLMYKTQGPLFDFAIIGKAPLANHDYVLAVGYNASTDVDTYIGTVTTNNDGLFELSGTADILSMTNAKAWLVPTENWVGGAMGWTGWPTSAANFLWETGLINYTKN